MNDRVDASTLSGARVGALFGERRPDLLREEVLADIFTATAAAVPDKPAFVSPGVSLTYAQAEERTNRMAHGLRNAGVRAGDVVGLWMPRGVDLLLAQIAVTKTGAAWLPFDADAPVERIAVCLADAGASCLVTAEALVERATDAHTEIHTPEGLTAHDDSHALDPRAVGVHPDMPAYLIYTSGSTGVPKGIVVSHRNICHFLRSANAVYGFAAEDVVFQGASVAFDLSMEEIWIPYLVGATLWVATPEVIGEADRLAGLMTREGITVIDTVPTLLSMIHEDVPSLRLVLLGGEALPPALVEAWAKPGRRLFNTYGPTEATVVATAAEVRAGEAVTIGGPIPNYSCYVVDDQMRLCPPGTQGELLIGGPGVAQGYLLRPELTAQKFIANPFPSDGLDPVLYRSGDAVSLDDEGRIHFHGRIDDQVKIRGFRVELGEIEARLAGEPGVAQAAVVLRNDDGIDRLVAFLVPAPGAEIDRMAVRVALREKLPSYMVPGWFEVVRDLPRLASGKLDRKSLRVAQLSASEPAMEQDEPRDSIEAALLDAARRALGAKVVPLEADFFTDLGGHSLVAARFISFVRETPSLAAITLQDVYAGRTLRAMAQRLADKQLPAGGDESLAFAEPPLERRFLCGLAQALAMPILLGIQTAKWLGVFITYILVASEIESVVLQAVVLMAVYVGITITAMGLGIAGKWLAIGRMKPGRYPVWGIYYFRWWLAQRFMTLVHAKLFQGSPVMAWYLRLLGAKIGKDAYICDFEAGAPDLLVIGEGAAIGSRTKFANGEVVGNELVIGEIVIGKDAYLGTSCVIEHDVVIGDHAELGDLTSLPAGSRIAACEKWDGSPGRLAGTVPLAELPAPAEASRARRSWNNAVYVAALFLIPPLGLVPIFPAFVIFDRLDEIISEFTGINYLWYVLALTWPTAIALIALTVGLAVLARWTIQPKRVREGVYSVHSGFYVRKWLVGLATEVTLETLTSLYATVYMRFWYRLMGARIGKGSEISTNIAGRYDLIEVGARNFIADEVVLGDEDVRRGWMTLKPVKTGDRVFVGNEGVVPPGTVIEDGTLIGVKSKPPALHVGADETWFGSPPIRFPNRQKVDGIDAVWTFEPSIWRKLGRAGFEALHTSLPTALTISCGLIAVETMMPFVEARDFATLVPVFLAASVAIAVVLVMAVCAIKWAMMGVYRPVMKPMWSWWAMRTEAVAVMYWGMAGKVLLEQLRGTPFLPWILRPFGVKTGKGVFMNSTDITEFDCITIGDFSSVNCGAALQTHLYEDRVMKVGRITLGRGVTVGGGAIVLYDSNVGDFARLGPLTMVMKGETIPEKSSWIGSPAQPAPAASHDRKPRLVLVAAE